MNSVEGTSGSNSFWRNEQGAIDLASIMVGIIVIGLVGAIIAATVFVIIPWVQDQAAKQQLDTIAAAENAYFGLTAAVPSPLPVGTKANSYGNSNSLETAGLLTTGDSYCTTILDGGSNYEAFAQSASGKLWSSTNKTTKPFVVAGMRPPECDEVYVDPTPTLTILTLQCNVDTLYQIPMQGNLQGKETWSDGTVQTYAATAAVSKALSKDVEYKITFDGTYMIFSQWESSAMAECLRSVDHWGSETKITNATKAFRNAKNLTNVPSHIPATITNMSQMFSGASSFNQPLDRWNTENVTDMNWMFSSAITFNQPLGHWNTSKVNDMSSMFSTAQAFNQPLDRWDTGKVTNMSRMFVAAHVFNQPINSWNTSNVTNMSNMFYMGYAFNQPLDKWDTGNVKNMDWMFASATAFNQPLNTWNTSNVTTMNNMFHSNTAFNQPLNTWNTSNVTGMNSMFNGAVAFNQPLNTWNTGNVTGMNSMFNRAATFNQPINNWLVAGVTSATDFRSASALTAVNSPFG